MVHPFTFSFSGDCAAGFSCHELVKMNKNGVPMQWQVTPYFIRFAKHPAVKSKLRSHLFHSDAGMVCRPLYSTKKQVHECHAPVDFHHNNTFASGYITHTKNIHNAAHLHSVTAHHHIHSLHEACSHGVISLPLFFRRLRNAAAEEKYFC